MSKNTIVNEFEIPSKGLIYGENQVSPTIKLRSWNGREELMRLSNTNLSYKQMSDLVQDCILNKEEVNVPVYDMCLGDFEFLLHRLRIVTYGDEYPFVIRCPFCGEVVDTTYSLFDLAVDSVDMREWEDALTITLPKCKKKIELRYSTPRMLDEIESKSIELAEEGENTKVLLRLVAHINTIDGEKLDFNSLKNFIYDLSAYDFNILDKSIDNLDELLGLDKKVLINCTNTKCKKKIPASFQYNKEFFRPTIN